MEKEPDLERRNGGTGGLADAFILLMAATSFNGIAAAMGRGWRYLHMAGA